jgi:peptidoglycan/LPS O-acetylase OafA/YrhL
MWWGGFAVGPAYLAGMIPYMVLPIAFCVERRDRSPWIWAMAVGLTVASVLLIWAETIAGQSFPDLTPNPLFTLSIPALVAGDIARNLGMIFKLRGQLSLLPLLLLVMPLLLMILRSSHASHTDSAQLAVEATQ